MNIRSNYSPLLNSLNGSYNATQDMYNVAKQRSQIQNGSYGMLMKSYVNKVGNKNALKAYQETGGITNEETSVNPVKKTQNTTKTSFLDDHFKNISKKTETNKTEGSVTKVTDDKYDKFKSSFLDDRLKTYDNKANAQTTETPEAVFDLKV